MSYNGKGLRWGEAALQWIERKKLARTSEGQWELACFLTVNKTTGYGIKLIEYCNGAVRSSCLAEHVSRSRSETLELIELCAREEVSPIHLPDFLADAFSQKILLCRHAKLCFG